MLRSLFCLLLIGSTVVPVVGQENSEIETTRKNMIEKAVKFLRSVQAESGGFTPEYGIGPTGVIVTGLIEAGVAPDDPMVAKALDFLAKAARKDGGIYSPESRFQNYETSISIMALAAANKKLKKPGLRGPYDEILFKAETYLRKCQFLDENNNLVKEEHRGGVGYGPNDKNPRPDLSNVHYFIDALKAMGRGPDDPAIKAALIFVSRSQNLPSEHNTLDWAKKDPDGGFVYLILDEDAQKALVARGQTGNPHRTYGSMTYAGLKSMIHAGVDKNDERVKAAYSWVRDRYTVDENPGIGQPGLYYYYQVMSKTLEAIGDAKIRDKGGKEHDWKAEIVGALSKRQLPNGSWVNESTRWLEGDPNLVTGYCLMVLADCQPGTTAAPKPSGP